jgi:hypothetical protein
MECIGYWSMLMMLIYLVETNAITKHSETLLDASGEVRLEENTERNKYEVTCHHQNAGRDNDSMIAHPSFENVVKFKYLGIASKNELYS